MEVLNANMLLLYLGIFFCIISISPAVQAEQYVFNFGNDAAYSTVIDTIDGDIPLLSFDNTVTIPDYPNRSIVHLKVVVEAWHKPQVTYNKVSKEISIRYGFLQITQSKYHITVKGTWALE